MKELMLIDSLLKSTGSTWATKEDIEAVFKKASISTSPDVLKDKGLLYRHEGCYTLPSYAEAENNIAINAMKLKIYGKQNYNFEERLIEMYIDDAECFYDASLHIQQRKAVHMIVSNGISILTGGPGTGKTFVLKVAIYVIRRLQNNNIIELTAPTGKAARRIVESTGERATTLHKKLEITAVSMEPTTYTGDTLLCDESSMIDNETGAALFKAVKVGKRLVLIGDTDQLPSVGIGAVLRDLIASAVIPITALTHTFRQANESILFSNICKIREGKWNLQEGEDFKMVKANGTKQEIENLILKEVLAATDKYGAENVITLIPYRQSGKTGAICSEQMNLKIQSILNPKPQGFRYTIQRQTPYTIFFRVDDFVMQLENRTECANGDVGKIIKVNESGITVKYVDCIVHYKPTELKQLALAYSMSIHKSQGSEYPAVVMVMLNEHSKMLQRNLLYTGVTRAKLECILIYQEEALKTAVATVADDKRLTFLKEKLQSLANQYRMAYGVS